MDQLQAYSFLFNDSLQSSLLFIPRLPYALDSMLAFNSYNPYIILIISFFANIIGSSINWILGILCRRLETLERFAHRIDSFKKAENFFNQKGKWILLLAAVPLWGSFFTTVAGALRLNFSQFIILVSFSYFIGLTIQIFF